MPCGHAIDAQLGQERVRHPPSHAQLQPPFETHFHAGRVDDDPADQCSKAGDQSYRAFAQQMANALARAHRHVPGVRSYECSVRRGGEGPTGERESIPSFTATIEREIKLKLIDPSLSDPSILPVK